MVYGIISVDFGYRSGTIDVEAILYGPLAITHFRDNKGNVKRASVIVHTASGLTVTGGMTIKNAKKIIEKLLLIADWNMRTGYDIVETYPYVRAAIRRLETDPDADINEVMDSIRRS